MEIWKSIKGHPLYEVSNFGKVRSWNSHYEGNVRSKPINLNPYINKAGYPTISLSSRCKIKLKKVHRAVLEAFGGDPPSNNHHCAHNDGNPENNHIDNLRWATHKENMADKKLHGTENEGVRNGMCVLTVSNVKEIKTILKTGLSAPKIASYSSTLLCLALTPAYSM